ncbi:hypothetical protein Tco_0027466 [Tanacetum coccineum]
MAGSDNESDDASVHSEATIPQQQQNIQPQIITTVSNNNAKFPYLKKDEYEVWAMKMEYWITNNDMNIWKVIQNGNSLKRTGRDHDGRVIILPPMTVDEHIAFQRESKARTTLLQSIPDDHVADFHYMDDARDIWNAVKAREFALMGVTYERVLQKNQLTLEDKIRVLSIELENTTNLLKHSERINAIAETAKKELQTKLDNHLVQIEKWRTSSKNLFRLIDSSMSVRTKVGLGFNNYIGENELGWDDSAFSVFTTNSEEVEGRPHFNRFAKTDSMKVVPPPLSGDYTPLSDHTDLDESQMSYGTKSSTSGDSNSVSNDFVSCDNSDKSSEVNTNDFASSDSSVKSSEPKSNDSTSCASTSSISTSESEAEIESNVVTPIQETINVQELPSFSCNSSDKNGNTSRTSCNKNGYFNKKAGHFRKNASSVSKLCFVCGSSTHLIKDCDFYEKQMANKTVGNGVGPVNSQKNVNHQNQFIPQVVLLRTGKVNIPLASPRPVLTGKLKVSAPVPTGWQNRPFPVPTDRGYSPSVTSENPYSDAEDEGIFDSGCSRSMSGNMERLDDFQEFQGGKVTFRGGEGRITGKGTIRTPTLDVVTKAFVGPRIGSVSNAKDFAEVLPKSVASSSFLAASLTLLPFAVQSFEGVCMKKYKYVQMFHVFKSSLKQIGCYCKVVKFIFQSSRYVVPTGRVVVPTGRYVVPAGKVIIIVSPGMPSLVTTGRIVSPGRVK